MRVVPGALGSRSDSGPPPEAVLSCSCACCQGMILINFEKGNSQSPRTYGCVFQNLEQWSRVLCFSGLSRVGWGAVMFLPSR